MEVLHIQRGFCICSVGFDIWGILPKKKASSSFKHAHTDSLCPALQISTALGMGG